jgi:hypothetical protein
MTTIERSENEGYTSQFAAINLNSHLSREKSIPMNISPEFWI